MHSRMIGGCLFAMMSACAGANRNAVPADLQRADGSPGLYVGHTNYGEVVVAATHCDAMSGLATTDADLGLPARKDGSGKMLCAREVATGSHFPRWSCRYQEDVEAERHRLHAEFDAPRLAIGRASAGPTATVNLGGRGGALNR